MTKEQQAAMIKGSVADSHGALKLSLQSQTRHSLEDYEAEVELGSFVTANYFRRWTDSSVDTFAYYCSHRITFDFSGLSPQNSTLLKTSATFIAKHSLNRISQEYGAHDVG